MIERVYVKTTKDEVIHNAPVSPPVTAFQVRRALEQQFRIDSFEEDGNGGAMVIVTAASAAGVVDV